MEFEAKNCFNFLEILRHLLIVGLLVLEHPAFYKVSDLHTAANSKAAIVSKAAFFLPKWHLSPERHLSHRGVCLKKALVSKRLWNMKWQRKAEFSLSGIWVNSGKCLSRQMFKRGTGSVQRLESGKWGKRANVHSGIWESGIWA